jgi:hypothetical protein
MVIGKANQACGYFAESRFVPFDAPGCLLRSIGTRKKTVPVPVASIYLADYNTAKFHRADSTIFLLTSHIPTVMNARVICFGSKEEAVKIKKFDDEIITDWQGFYIRRGTPDRIHDLVLGKNGFSPQVALANKGELILLSYTSKGLEADLTIELKGYPEVEKLVLPASGEAVEMRVLATRPGAGFPIIDSENKPLGMLRVEGAHTTDEEAM